ncbi:binding-protein-dependent transport systems inner membrane component [Olsenella uli DSM 7084]|uniref:Binding-protein-dependent transport systems inner membrane component n=1 Tax=Olsenella uli (strain ATCC 49627 / DSM 7084 / CCUG 31166 / CIP 109912 / JCM 12494 / LMG 11480 / NCIMB 702895 / VPI D76D-27C) TaxID=633147 RepID=E1QW67_OLSUV|nr:ABC transporter permease [Olsenella uli]ADK68370.1 binding-protein-dependent transport systems inner membrane component [Olsenella uli DSM 7084]
MADKGYLHSEDVAAFQEAPTGREDVAPDGAATVSDAPVRTLWGDAWKRLRRNRLAMIALAWIVFMVIVALSADLWVPQTLGNPTEIDSSTMTAQSRLAPSLEHPFGTDTLGRDVLCRVIYGARISLAVGVLATAISTVIGLVMGALAAYYGGIWDTIIMRLADIFLAFPYTLFVIAMLAVIGQGIQNVFIAIGVLGWPSIARVFRSAILTVKENDYVDAARSMGAADIRIVSRHIFPNSVASIVVYATMNIGGAILTESALSYLGMGVIPPDPSWGIMIQDGQTYLATQPWLMIMPGLAILTTVLAFTLLGDGLRDALDVKMKDA